MPTTKSNVCPLVTFFIDPFCSKWTLWLLLIKIIRGLDDWCYCNGQPRMHVHDERNYQHTSSPRLCHMTDWGHSSKFTTFCISQVQFYYNFSSNAPPLFQVLLLSVMRLGVEESIFFNTVVLMSCLHDSASITAFRGLSNAGRGTNCTAAYPCVAACVSWEQCCAINFCRSASTNASFAGEYVRSVPTKHTYK